jgi:hypothetical protein
VARIVPRLSVPFHLLPPPPNDARWSSDEVTNSSHKKGRETVILLGLHHCGLGCTAEKNLVNGFAVTTLPVLVIDSQGRL